MPIGFRWSFGKKSDGLLKSYFRSFLWINRLHGLLGSITILVNSLDVAASLLSLSDGSMSFSNPRILRQRCCTLSNSSSRYCGIPPQTGDAYSSIGRILVVYVSNPNFGGKEDFYILKEEIIAYSPSLLFYRHE